MAIDRIQDNIINNIANKNNISNKDAEKIYYSVFKFIRNVTNELPIKELETNVEINKLKTNFNIPRFGKMYINVPKIMAIKNIINK